MARIAVTALDRLTAAAHGGVINDIIHVPEEYVEGFLAAGKIALIEPETDPDPANGTSEDEPETDKTDKPAADRQDKTDKGAASRKTK